MYVRDFFGVVDFLFFLLETKSLYESVCEQNTILNVSSVVTWSVYFVYLESLAVIVYAVKFIAFKIGF